MPDKKISNLTTINLTPQDILPVVDVSEPLANLKNKKSSIQQILNLIPPGVPIDSPNFLGNPTAPTLSIASDDEGLATTAFVKAVFNTIIPAVPDLASKLDTTIYNTFIERRDNPFVVTSQQVGNNIPQWNASQLQGFSIASDVPIEGQFLLWNEEAVAWIPTTVNPSLVNDATVNEKGVILLAGDLSGTADAPTVPSLINLTAHTQDIGNPHLVTATQVGAIPLTEKGALSGVATLDEYGTVPSSQLPPASNSVFSVNEQVGAVVLTAIDVSAEPSGAIAIHETTVNHPLVTTDTIGMMNAVDKVKLDGLAANATANSTDELLRDRETHTGVQPISSVADLQNQLDSKALIADLIAHTSGTANPHLVTAEQVGLGSIVVDLSTHTSDINNPHVVTPTQLGNTTAQWNANQLQGYSITVDPPTHGAPLVWNEIYGVWRSETIPPAQVGNATAQWNANQLQGYNIASGVPTDGLPLVWSDVSSAWINTPIPPSQVGNGIAQWNASKLQGFSIAVDTPSAGQFLVWSDVYGVWTPTTVTLGSGVATPDATTDTKGSIQLAGDLSGTADAPTVPVLTTHIAHINNPHSVTASQVGSTTAQWNASKIQGRNVASTAPTNDQILSWDSTTSTWKPITISSAIDALKIQGRNIASTAPTSDQALIWDSTASMWKPGTITGGGTGTTGATGATGATGPAGNPADYAVLAKANLFYG